MRLIIFLSCVAWALAAQKSYDGHKVYSIQLENRDQLELIKSWEDFGIDIWDGLNTNRRPIRVMVPPLLLKPFEDFLGEQNILSDLIIDNVTETLLKEQEDNNKMRSQNQGRSTFTFDFFLTYSEITSYLQGLASSYANLISVSLAGKTYENRDMLLVKTSNTGFDGSKPVIFIDAGIHAREWIAPMSILYLIHELVEHPEDHLDMLAVDWMIVPVANPDGYIYTHETDRLWRKTRSSNEGSSCMGTDPNRNFPYMWEVATSVSDNPCSLNFRGFNPLVEPEVKVLTQLLTENKDLIKLYLAVHSYGEYLLYVWGYDFDIPNPFTDQLHELGVRVANAILTKFPDRDYTVGNSASELYPASGASDDFAAGVAGVNLAYTVELSGGGSYGFDLPASLIERVSSEIFVAYREYALYIAENF